MPRKKALVAPSRKMCQIIFSVMHNNKPFEVRDKFKSEQKEIIGSMGWKPTKEGREGIEGI